MPLMLPTPPGIKAGSRALREQLDLLRRWEHRLDQLVHDRPAPE
jgi:hypothetical protein